MEWSQTHLPFLLSSSMEQAKTHPFSCSSPWLTPHKPLPKASQPKIKKEFFNSGFNQENWDYILLKTEENNKELINGEIEKIFKLNVD